MKKIITIFLLSIAAYYAYKNNYLGNMSGAEYSLSNIENKPIPQENFFELWHETALKMCSDSTKSFNINQNQCINKVDSQKESCRVTVGQDASTIIESEYEAKQLGKAYLHCVLPGYHCNGIEAKTEEEVRRYCK